MHIYPSLFSVSFLPLFLTLVLIFAGGAHVEGLNGSLHVLRDSGGHLRKKVEATEMELRELTAWKEVQVNKLDLMKKLLEESEAQSEVLMKVLKDKDYIKNERKEI